MMITLETTSHPFGFGSSHDLKNKDHSLRSTVYQNQASKVSNGKRHGVDRAFRSESPKFDGNYYYYLDDKHRSKEETNLSWSTNICSLLVHISCMEHNDFCGESAHT